MLSREGTRLQVFLELRRLNGLRSGPDELVVLDKHTIERPWGWAFFYTTQGSPMAILNSLSAAMLHTSSTVSTELCDPLAPGSPIEYYIQE